MKIKNYKDLDIWKRSIKLVEDIYRVTKSFPREELYGLTSQIRRAAVSIPSNIAEGFTRFHNKEYKQFLYIALGSCSELSTQLIIASRLKYFDNNKIEQLLNGIDEICRMTMSLIKKINSNLS